jgi:hypothetical protein
MLTSDRGSVNRIARVLAEEILRTFGQVRLRAFGTSMVPSILPGDLILVQRVVLHDISLDDVVLFSQGGRLFLHRVVKRHITTLSESPSESRLITRGDRLCHDDPAIGSFELLGRVRSIQRGSERPKPILPRGILQQLLASLLRTSELATRLFIHLVVWRRFVFSEGKAAC